jgi:SulP family sulfate permease
VLAGVFALRAVSRTARLEEVPLEPGDYREEERALLAQHIVAYRLDGPLLFAAAHRFLLELTEIAPVAVVILRMSRLSAVDATGVQVLRDAVRRLEHRGVTVLVSGVRDEHRRALDTLDLRVFEHTPDAIDHARSLLRERDVLP